ncbi:ATP-binding cassette domain-containing protein [Sedimentibacter sp. MB31-C6]|uniref:ATP-binding cassette domain-containing protein n=1 Tax=Sedimentibacter sp. MB31-C6 TaxID=3109366 RepID=UPI002DDCEF3D|nr:ATP-binding cassette domain-containing protein [Sedimentibacter sp. MB36-C1]WSI03624.1 ATP-binding cassette domain-containing protein [Sedimentibacter sp. MB36-C1]
MNNPKEILKVKDLEVKFGDGCVYCLNGGVLDKGHCPHCHTVWALNKVSFDLYEGEILGIVGESGSGKSTLLRAVYFDRKINGGEAYISDYGNGKVNIFDISSQKKRYIRNSLMGMVYQNPIMGLRMNFSNGGNISEKLIAAGSRKADSMTKRAKYLLSHVEVPVSRIKEEPRNFSGGMQQRVQISKALANNPPILLLDEVTTGLDLSVQARVLDLIKGIQQELGIAMIVVSHDLSVIRMMADRTLVMLEGRIIEEGLTDQILEDPAEEFTQTLVHSLL